MDFDTESRYWKSQEEQERATIGFKTDVDRESWQECFYKGQEKALIGWKARFHVEHGHKMLLKSNEDFKWD